MSFLRALVLLTAFETFFIAAPARADEPTIDFRPRSYGWQIVVSDVASVATTATVTSLFVAIPSLNASDAWVGPLTALGPLVLFTGPIVHLAHRRYGMAAASFGMRLAIVGTSAIIGFGVGLAVNHDNLWDAFLTGPFVGASIGLVGASAIDALVLARRADTTNRTIGVTPSVSFVHGGALASVGGAF